MQIGEEGDAYESTMHTTQDRYRHFHNSEYYGRADFVG
jgi:hypothetical protein